MKLDNLVFRYSTGMLFLMCLCAFGCSNNVKVTGTVTYSDNGDPVKSGTIFFTGETELGRATITNGKYSIGRINDGDGIPRGTYTVASDALFVPAPRAETVMSLDGTPLQVSTGDQSTQEREVYYTKEPQTIEVKKSMTYDFQVERGSRPR
jgi:hypothetical protein